MNVLNRTPFTLHISTQGFEEQNNVDLYIHTKDQLTAITRAVFEAGRQMGRDVNLVVFGDSGVGKDWLRSRYPTADDYLNSEEYKKLVGE